jgi:thiamine biosynthesis lipoprotein
MATRFELVLHGADPTRLRAAGEEALDEITRAEGMLSLYRPESEIAHLNARAAREPVRVSPLVFDLLLKARELSNETDGAFDISAGPLTRAWGFVQGVPNRPSGEELERCRSITGMPLVQLEPSDRTVRFHRAGVMIDLGAIGKGYAVDRAIEVLREAGVASALLHAGTSTVCTIGSPPGSGSWKVGIEDPRDQSMPGADNMLVRLQTVASTGREKPQKKLLLELELCDEALSVSSPHGKYFASEGVVYGHVVDPRNGMPVRSSATAVVVLPSATESDALSTALLVLGEKGLSKLVRIRPGIRLWLEGATA